jgi:hypothetical protein
MSAAQHTFYIAMGALALLGSSATMAGLLVTEAVGKIEIEGKGPVNALAQIPDDARLKVPAGAKLVVVDLGSGREYVLPGNLTYIAAASGPRTVDGKAVAARPLPISNLPDVKVVTPKVAQATLVMRTLPKTNVPVLVSPVKTAVISLMPTLRWTAVAAATNYKLTVTQPDGSLVWEAVTQDNEITLPAGQTLQAGGRYNWRVEAMGAGGRLSDAAARFTVASAEALTALALLKPDTTATFSRRVLYAAQLREAGALEDAKLLWQALSREQPDDPVLAILAE